MLGHMVISGLVFRENTKNKLIFRATIHYFTFHQRSMHDPVSLHHYQHSLLSVFKILAIFIVNSVKQLRKKQNIVLLGRQIYISNNKERLSD